MAGILKNAVGFDTPRYVVKNGYVTDVTTNETYPIDYTAVKGGTLGTKKDLDQAISHWLNTGTMPEGGDVGRLGPAMRNISTGLMAFRDTHNFNDFTAGNGTVVGDPEKITIDPVTGKENDPRLDALNTYYKDLYESETPGTGGYRLRNELEGVFQREANVGVQLADVQFQDQAMNQAAVIKQITDSVRNERMSRLKAGMSESQIANQDMQMMMSNVNALNENNKVLGQNRIMAQGAQATAKDQAYMSYLDQANARGQNAAAYSAADAGNANFMAQQYASQTGISYAEAYKIVTGQTQ